MKLGLMIVLAPFVAFAAGSGKYELKVSGMHCGECVDHLREKLETRNDIEKGTVTVDLKGKTATVTIMNVGKDAASLEKLKKSLNQTLADHHLEVKDVKVID